MSFIELKHLQVKIGQKQILKDINLKIEKSSTTVFIGPSGAGKTTLLRTFNLLQKPSSGQIKLDNVTLDFSHPDRHLIKQYRDKSAMVFQQFNLFKNLTVERNVAAPLIYNRILGKQAALQRANEILTQLGLEKVAKQYPATLSGGQQQRVSIARAIAIKPEIMLLDEPTSALDPEMVGEVLNTIEALTKQNITTILVTHEMDFARRVADQVVFVEDGKIRQQGSPRQLLADQGDSRVISFVNSLARKDA